MSPPPHPASVQAALARILASRHFAHAQRLSAFLRLIVETTLRGDSAAIKEFLIATAVYQRDQTYDPRIDSIVRVEAGRLRERLRAYYAAEGAHDPLRIDLPKGGYIPVFIEQLPAEPVAAPPTRAASLLPRRALLVGGISSAAAATAFIAARGSRTELPVALLMTAETAPRGGGGPDADRLALELANALGRNPGLKVLRSDNPPELRQHSKSIETANHLVILTARGWENPGLLRAVAELRDTATSDALWSTAVEDRCDRSAALAESAAAQIAAAIRRFPAPALTPQRRTAQRLYAETQRALGLGKDFLLKSAGEIDSNWPLEELMQAARLLERAVAEDPAFAAGHAWLAEVYRLASEYDPRIYPRCQEAVRTSLRLDPDSAKANFVKGYCAFFTDWDFAAAEPAFRRAIERSRLYVDLYRYHTDAATLIRKETVAAPYLFPAASVLPRTLPLAFAAAALASRRGDFAETERLSRENLVMHPGSVPVRCQLVTALAHQSKFAEADREMTPLLDGQPLTLRLIATQATVYAMNGRTPDALQ